MDSQETPRVYSKHPWHICPRVAYFKKLVFPDFYWIIFEIKTGPNSSSVRHLRSPTRWIHELGILQVPNPKHHVTRLPIVISLDHSAMPGTARLMLDALQQISVSLQ